MLSPSYPTLFVNKHIDTEMLYCWVIVSKFCPNLTETDIAFAGAWAQILWHTIPASTLPIELNRVNPPAKACIDDSTTLIQVYDTLSHYHGYECFTSNNKQIFVFCF